MLNSYGSSASHAYQHFSPVNTLGNGCKMSKAEAQGARAGPNSGKVCIFKVPSGCRIYPCAPQKGAARHSRDKNITSCSPHTQHFFLAVLSTNLSTSACDLCELVSQWYPGTVPCCCNNRHGTLAASNNTSTTPSLARQYQSMA